MNKLVLTTQNKLETDIHYKIEPELQAINKNQVTNKERQERSPKPTPEIKYMKLIPNCVQSK